MDDADDGCALSLAFSLLLLFGPDLRSSPKGGNKFNCWENYIMDLIGIKLLFYYRQPPVFGGYGQIRFGTLVIIRNLDERVKEMRWIERS